MKLAIESCPFCGNYPKVTKHFKYPELHGMIHRCEVLHVTISFDFVNIRESLKKWNTRSHYTASAFVDTETGEVS